MASEITINALKVSVETFRTDFLPIFRNDAKTKKSNGLDRNKQLAYLGFEKIESNLGLGEADGVEIGGQTPQHR